ncbi:MAG: M23 family metallopeptidase [Vicinamibacterales bacterium]
MIWFSVGLPLVLQALVPIALLSAIAAGTATPLAHAALILFTTAYLVAIGVAGLWLVLPWWMPWLYGGVLVVAVARAVRRWPARTTARARWPWMVIAAGTVGAVAAATITAVAWRGRRAPAGTVELASPFTSGTYLVVNGGMSQLLSAHLATLDGERFRPYRGQSYGVDLVKIDRLGLRARGVLPRDPAAYGIFGEPVVAPCTGRVIAAEDGAPDMPPPETDRAHMAGNHVLLDCDGVWVLLGHLQSGSVAVRTGQPVRRGTPIGRAGNSGNTGEPHLHVHAQRPGPVEAPLGGDPLPIRIDGRFLVRNDRLSIASGDGR